MDCWCEVFPAGKMVTYLCVDGSDTHAEDMIDAIISAE